MNNLNKIATHPLQSLQWGQFREKTGVKVVRGKSGFAGQLIIHKIPCLPAGKAHTPFNIGYLPKGPIPTKEMANELVEIGKQEKCIFIQFEPNVRKDEIGNWKLEIGNSRLRRAAHPLFTKYTFILDLTKSEEELLKNMHPKTRYNIKIAQKHNVKIVEDNSTSAFEEYLKLTKETTQRQNFYAHSESYHRIMWETLKGKATDGKLTAHLFLAKYKDEVLTAWILFVFKDTLYYPYGASSSKFRETMSSNLMMWEAIKFGKKLGLKKFDMWGALGPEPDSKDPWYGFHRFKEGYGPELVEFVGSYDLIINPVLYELYKVTDKLRWFYLKLVKP